MGNKFSKSQKITSRKFSLEESVIGLGSRFFGGKDEKPGYDQHDHIPYRNDEQNSYTPEDHNEEFPEVVQKEPIIQPHSSYRDKDNYDYRHEEHDTYRRDEHGGYRKDEYRD